MEELIFNGYQQLGPFGFILVSLVVFVMGRQWDVVWDKISPLIMKKVEAQQQMLDNQHEESDFNRRQKMLELEAELKRGSWLDEQLAEELTNSNTWQRDQLSNQLQSIFTQLDITNRNITSVERSLIENIASLEQRMIDRFVFSLTSDKQENDIEPSSSKGNVLKIG